MRSADTHLDMGMLPLKLFKSGDEPPGRDRRHGGDRYDRLPGLGPEAVDRICNIVKRLADRESQNFALLGQLNAARQAAKQLRAEDVFKLADVPADRTLRYVDFLGRPAKTLISGGSVKGLECI